MSTNVHKKDSKDGKVLAQIASMAEEIAEGYMDTEQEQDQQAQVIKLDTEDSLRLENLILKNKIAQMSVTLAESQSKENQEAFQSHLIAKLGVNVATHQMQVNPANHTVTIVPR